MVGRDIQLQGGNSSFMRLDSSVEVKTMKTDSFDSFKGERQKNYNSAD